MDEVQVDIKRRGIRLSFRHNNMARPDFVKESLGHHAKAPNLRPFSPREKVAEGRMRGMRFKSADVGELSRMPLTPLSGPSPSGRGQIHSRLEIKFFI